MCTRDATLRCGPQSDPKRSVRVCGGALLRGRSEALSAGRRTA